MKRIPISRSLVIYVALALAYYGTARLGLSLAFAATNVSPVWPPSGIAFAALLLLGKRQWPGILVGAFAANFMEFSSTGALSGVPAVAASLAIAVGNTLEALVGVLLLRRLVGQAPILGEPKRIYCFVAVAAIMCVVGAAIGMTSLLLAGVVPFSALRQIGLTWWLGDAAGILVVCPFILAWSAPLPPWRWQPRAAAIAAASLLALAMALGLLFGRRYDGGHAYWGLAFLLLPTIGWTCFRYGVRGVTLLLLLLTGAAVVGTTKGLGPFSAGTLNDALSSLEIFIALSSMVGMVLASDREAHLQRPGHEREAGKRSTRLYLFQWAVLLSCLGLTILVWHYVATGTEQRAQDLFQAKVEDVRRRVAERMETYAQVLIGGKALFQASAEISRQDWQVYVSSLNVTTRYPGIQVLGVADRVTERERLAGRMQAAGLPGYRVWPEGERGEYIAVVYAEPLDAANARALGYDLSSEPVRHVALARAVQTGALAITGRVTLVQGSGAEPRAGFLMVVPIFRKGAPLATRAEREGAIERYVYAAFQMDDLMRGVFPSPVSKVALEVFDGRTSVPGALIYADARATGESVPAYPNPYSAVVSVGVGDGQWTLKVTSLPEFEADIDRDKATIVLVSGMMISLLFFSVVRALTANREEAIQHAVATTSALRQSERKFGALVESAIAFSIISTDLEGIIQVFSVGAERMLGYDAGELVGRATPAVFHVPDEVAQRSAELSREFGRPITGFAVFTALALQGREESREWRYVRKNGTTLPVRLTVTPIRDEAGTVTGFLGIAKDITVQKQTEQDLRAAKQRADAASDAKSEFVANMSHELRTPLNAVLGIAELLDRTELSTAQHQDLAMIRQSGKTLLGILNDILDFSKIEAGKMDLSVTRFDLDALLAAVAMVMGVSAGRNAVELAVDVDPALPAMLMGDALRLQQVLVNLAGNAIKFTLQGSVAMHVGGALTADGMVALRITVRDTGIGMSSEQLGRLFSAFTQADSSMTRRFGGTGLGLTISRRLVDMMGGAITVESREGAGSVFTVELALPAADPQAASIRAAAAPALDVLIVGCSPVSSQALTHAAQRLGWRPRAVSASDVARLRGGQGLAHTADAVLLDWCACDGADASAAVRRLRGESSALVLLMLSCHERAQLKVDPALLGADHILDKPATAASLLAGVQSARQRRECAPIPSGPTRGAAGMLAGRVLLVEDNELNQYIAKAMLAALGLGVELAVDGQMAVDMLRARPHDFDLVLMDVQMPVMDGFAATRLIRQELALRLPVVAMTAGVMEYERNSCLVAGMDDFIGKPVDAGQLRAVLERYLLPGGAPPRAAAADAAASSAVFDIGALLRSLSAYPGHLQTVTKMVRLFVDGGTGAFDSAQLAWQDGQGEAAARALHSLRGSAGSLGAKRFAELCLELEAALAQGDAGRSAALFGCAAAALAASLAQAAAWLAMQEPAPAGAEYQTLK